MIKKKAKSENVFVQSAVGPDIKVGFWNIRGFNSLYNLLDSEIKVLLNIDILCFCETWLYQEDILPPKFLEDYIFFSSRAIKYHKKGRASGGLIF